MSADITQCNDKNCNRKERCYRYIAIPDKEYQSYFLESPRDDKMCEMFWIANKVQKQGYRRYLKIKEKGRKKI